MSVQIGYSRPVEQDFLLSARELTILLKDGYSFFRANAAVLKERFKDASKKTTIVIVHPDSPNLTAIASMDIEKAGKPDVQKNDCLQAIACLHKIMDEILTEGTLSREDLESRVAFIGHDFVPTYNGFIGDDLAIINHYTTRAYRGPLVSMRVARQDPDHGLLYEAFRKDIAEIVRNARAPRHNLWKFTL